MLSMHPQLLFRSRYPTNGIQRHLRIGQNYLKDPLNPQKSTHLFFSTEHYEYSGREKNK